MKAMILAAGLGTRLKPLTDHCPKAMLEVGGAPLIHHQLGWLAGAGVTEVVINLHHLGEQIEACIGDGAAFGLSVCYSREPVLLETGGGLVQALPLLGDEPFWLLLGDIYTDFPFDQFARRLGDEALVHMLLTPTPPFRRRGDFEWDGEWLTGRGDSFVFCGLALIHPRLLDGREAVPFSLSGPYFKAVAEGAVTGQLWRGFWTDIGSPEQLEALRERLVVP